MISIPYSRTNGVYTFTDTVILSEDAYAAMTPEEITSMQDARFAAWVAYVEEASNTVTSELFEMAQTEIDAAALAQPVPTEA